MLSSIRASPPDSRTRRLAELSLVTDGAGFIGSRLAEELVRCGRPVRILDDLSTGLRVEPDPPATGILNLLKAVRGAAGGVRGQLQRLRRAGQAEDLPAAARLVGEFHCQALAAARGLEIPQSTTRG